MPIQNYDDHPECHSNGIVLGKRTEVTTGGACSNVDIIRWSAALVIADPAACKIGGIPASHQFSDNLCCQW